MKKRIIVSYSVVVLREQHTLLRIKIVMEYIVYGRKNIKDLIDSHLTNQNGSADNLVISIFSDNQSNRVRKLRTKSIVYPATSFFTSSLSTITQYKETKKT